MEFRNEIQTLSKIEHLNLVRFYGYIEHGEDRMILVEYVANGTLREHLDGKSITFFKRAISYFHFVHEVYIHRIDPFQVNVEVGLKLESVWIS